MRIQYRVFLFGRVSACAGQALAELTVALVVLVMLVVGVSTLARLCVRQQELRRDVRARAGVEALRRSTKGWVDEPQRIETRADRFHRINSVTRLDAFSPALTSHLPASHYTLAARDMPEGELGLKETQREEVIILDAAFVNLIYGKGTVRLSESVTFPAASGLWK